jgi:phosphoribosylglycinamide formyltransferase-1
MQHIAIFASGSGTNALNIIQYFANSPNVKVRLIVTNNPQASVIQKAEHSGVDVCINKLTQQHNEIELLSVLKQYDIHFIALAGFLKLIPQSIITAYENRIVNIHPALLPQFGGKGMYGMRVHEAVIASGEPISGITIHFVNPMYDEGQIVFQHNCLIEQGETPQTLALKIHALEYEHYPKIIEMLLIDL